MKRMELRRTSTPLEGTAIEHAEELLGTLTQAVLLIKGYEGKTLSCDDALNLYRDIASLHYTAMGLNIEAPTRALNAVGAQRRDIDRTLKFIRMRLISLENGLREDCLSPGGDLVLWIPPPGSGGMLNEV